MQKSRSEEKNAVPTSIRNPRIFGHRLSALRSRLARSLHFVSGFVCPTPRRWQRIIHSPQSQDLDSQTQTEQCRSSLAGGKCDIQKIATSSHRVSRFGIERASIRGRESSRLLIGARLEMLMPHLKYIKAANLRGRCEDRVGERGGRWCALPPQIWRLSLSLSTGGVGGTAGVVAGDQ